MLNIGTALLKWNIQGFIVHNGGWNNIIRSLSDDMDLNINYFTHIPVYVVMDKMTQKEQTEWRNTIAFKPKLKTFVKCILVYRTKLYVSSPLPKNKRALLSQFRCGV